MHTLFIYLSINLSLVSIYDSSYIKINVSLSVRFLSLLFIVIKSKDETNIEKKNQ